MQVPNSRKDFLKLVLPIPASQLSGAVCSGYTEVSLMGSWDRYWSLVHSGCLYLYQNHDSQVTHHTIMLKGWSLNFQGTLIVRILGIYVCSLDFRL